MPYIADMNRMELRQHMTKLHNTEGWNHSVYDRLFKEILDQDVIIAELREWITECRDRVLWPLAHENSKYACHAESLGGSAVDILNSLVSNRGV